MTASRRIRPATEAPPMPPPPTGTAQSPPRGGRRTTRALKATARGTRRAAVAGTVEWWQYARYGFWPTLEFLERLGSWIADADGKPAGRTGGGVTPAALPSGGGQRRPSTAAERRRQREQRQQQAQRRRAEAKHDWKVRTRVAGLIVVLGVLALPAVLLPLLYALPIYLLAIYAELWVVGRVAVKREEDVEMLALMPGPDPDDDDPDPGGGGGGGRPLRPDVITETTIRRAMLTGKFPGVNETNVADVVFTQPPTPTVPPLRPGTVSEVVLPPGALASAAAQQGELFASHFPGRSQSCFDLEPIPTGGVGSLRVFIADRPWAKADSALTLPLQPANVFDNSVVLLLDLLGRPVRVSLLEMILLFGGISGLGKSTLMSALGLQTSLDPQAEVWIFAMKDSPDWSPFEPIAHRYYVTSDLLEARARWAMWLDYLEAEMEARQRILKTVPDVRTRVDSDLSRAGIGLHPLVVFCDEFAGLWQDEALIERTAKLYQRCLGVGMVFVNSLQDAVGQAALPSPIGNAQKIRVSFATATTTMTNSILGDGAHGRGLRAHELPKGEPGRVYAVLPDGRSGEFRTPVVAPAHMEEILRCAVALREQEGTRTGAAVGESPDEQDPAQSVLTLALDAMRAHPEHSGARGIYLDDLAALLRDAHPDRWASLDRDRVRALLEDEQVPIEQPLRIPPFTRGAMGVFRESLEVAYRRQFGAARAS